MQTRVHVQIDAGAPISSGHGLVIPHFICLISVFLIALELKSRVEDLERHGVLSMSSFSNIKLLCVQC